MCFLSKINSKNCIKCLNCLKTSYTIWIVYVLLLVGWLERVIVYLLFQNTNRRCQRTNVYYIENVFELHLKYDKEF